MSNPETGRSSIGGPQRTLSMGVGSGGPGAELARRVSERMRLSSREGFRLATRQLPTAEDSRDLTPLIEALLDGVVDFAACSAEHLPLDLPSGIRFEGALRADPAAYRLLSRPSVSSLGALADGARVAACDATARAQILFARPTLAVEIVPEPLLAASASLGRWDAAVVAASSMELTGFSLHAIPPAQLMPPSGRGVIALLSADTSDPAEPWRRLLNEPDTEDCLICERAFLARMASCTSGLPIASATRLGGRLELHALLAHPDGRWLVGARASGPPSFGRILGLEAAESCRESAPTHESRRPGVRAARGRSCA